jgi:hypothetical protein
VKGYPILVDPEFRSLIPPMSPEERAQLKENIKEHGLLDHLLLWAGEGVTTYYEIKAPLILIDGHSRFGILEELAKEDPEKYSGPEEWDYTTTQFDCEFVYLPDREAVKLWILEHQVGRRNLTKQQRIEMVARIVVLRQEQTSQVSRANLVQNKPVDCSNVGTTPDVTETVPSGKRTVAAAAKEFDVPREPLQNAVNKAKGKPAATKKADHKTKTPSLGAAAPATLSESFYVIRRKSDGAFFQDVNFDSNVGLFIPNIDTGENTGFVYYSPATHYLNPEEFEDPEEESEISWKETWSSRKKIKLERKEWEWVKVRAEYKLTAVPQPKEPEEKS